MIPTVAVAAAIVLGWWWRQRRGQAAELDRARAAVPDLVELLVLLVRAGLTPPLAFGELARAAPIELRPLVVQVVERMSGGERFADSLDSLRAPGIPTLEQLVGLLAHAERHGEPIGPVLERLATEGRAERRRLADAAARRLPVRLCFPLVCCTLPAFVVLAIVPMLAGALSSFQRLRP